MQLHEDSLTREQWIRDYLLRRLDPASAEQFEQHYLGCDECFEELRATRLLMSGLTRSGIGRRRLQDVVVLEFSHPAQLVRQAQELRQLLQGVVEQSDTKVLIDLSRVSRIDSAGLGMLINCYSHAVRKHGMLKLLKPSEPVKNLLRLTRIDSVIETYFDEAQAVESFG
jgi:anti-sigma B factor antagonist